MTKVRRVIFVVLDSVGVGELPDADQYGDVGSNTLGNTAKAVGGLHLPNMGSLGLGNILEIEGVPPVEKPLGAYGRMAEASAGKDTTIGHWELAGLYSPTPLPTYPHGFPPHLIAEFERRIGRPTLGNVPASGTVIIQVLGAEHMRTGWPIVYTSADSVFQIAAHEDIVPIEELYRMSRIARDLLTGEHNVGRVIARPFVGRPGHFVRTERRKDFSAPPPGPTLLDHVCEAGLEVMGVGKIEDIFANQGLTQSNHSGNNMAAIDAIVEFMRQDQAGLIIANLVDFDMLYGHRNDPRGYADALEAVDRRLPEITGAMHPEDVLVLTADHGNDPTTPSTDHSREYVPVLLYGAPIRPGVNVGTRPTFADLGQTIAELLGVKPLGFGTSFAEEILRK
ncbi:MAG: phosphopentomutase [Chloroflexi bacterium]|nr:phosphopentomutase [Chloroflexota bacterium]